MHVVSLLVSVYAVESVKKIFANDKNSDRVLREGDIYLNKCLSCLRDQKTGSLISNRETEKGLCLVPLNTQIIRSKG